MNQSIMNKENWVGLYKELGLTEDQMKRWHSIFEARYPEGHQAFLAWLNIAPKEIEAIRAESKK